MSSAGSLWVEILPKFVGTRAAMQAEMVPAANSIGAEAGAAISKGVGEGAKAGAAEASASIRSTIVESAKVSAAEANAILARVGTGTFAKQLAAEMKSAEDAVTRSAQQMQIANEKAIQSSEAVQLAERKLAEARAKYAADSSQVVAAENRLADAERKSALAAEEVKTATATNASAQGAYVTARNKVKDAEEAGKLKTAEAEAAQSKLTNALNATVPGLASVGAGYSKMGALLAGVFVVAMGEKAVKSAGDFQASQMRLVTTAGELQKNLDLVSQGVLHMAGEVGYSAQELSKGMYTVESAGYHGADALKVMKAAAEGAKTENADLTTVTDAVTSSMQDYHLGADQAALVTSKLVTAVGMGKTNFQDFTGAMSAILPVASSAHISMDEILGDLSSMTLHGMSAQQASQNLADAVRHLMSPTAAMTKEMAALGLSSADLSKNLGTTGVQGTMDQIAQAILTKMGPAGTTLLNAFNQSKQAAADAEIMFKALPPAAQKVAQSVKDGTMSFAEFRKSGGGLAVEQKAQVDQWLSVQKAATGFNDALKTGGNASQTFSQAMAKATGDSASLNVALMLTGENAGKTQENIKAIAASTTEAGGHVKGWAEIQQTFNQKLDQFKAGIGALVIELGQKLLPVATGFMTVLMNVAGWVKENRTWIGLLAAVIGAMLVPIVAVKTGLLAWSVAAKVVALAQAALNAVMSANPIMLIVMAIAALVAGVIYAYNHFQWFRTAVQAVWAALKTAAEWVAHAGIAVWHALVAAFDAVMTAVKAVGAFFTWLWEHILSPVFNAIGLAVRILYAIFFTVLIVPVVLIVKNILAPVFTWLYEHVIKPVFGLIGEIFSWLYEHVVKPIIAFIKAEIQAWGIVIHWIYDNVIKPVFDAIGATFHWIYENIIKPIVAFIKAEIQAWGVVIHWIYDNVIKPVFDDIGSVFHWIYENIIKPIIAGVKAELHAWADVFTWLHDHVIKPIGDAIGSAFHGIGQAVSDVVDWIKSTWNKVQEIVKVPAKFVVQTVYDDAIVPVWNGIAGVFGLGKINPVDVSHWAGGGIVPGYQPGVDSIPAMLSPGEAVLVPEAARMLGYDNIMALNAMSGRPSGNATNGMPVHASGGFLNWVGDAVSGVGHFIAGAASSLWDSLQSIGGWIAKGVGAVVGNVTGLFSGATDAANSAPGQGNDFKKALTSLPSHVIKAAIDKIKEWFSSNSTAVAGVIPSGAHLAIIDAALAADGIPRGDWPRWEAGLNTLIQRESGWNASIMNMWDSNAQAGHPSGGLAQVIMPTFMANRNPSLPNNLLDPVANVAAAINYILRRYGDIGRVQQANANMPPKGYDSGGWLQPGTTAVVNASGRPEPVFSSSQWDVLKANLRKSHGGGDRHYHITTHDPASVLHEIERKDRAEMSAKLI